MQLCVSGPQEYSSLALNPFLSVVIVAEIFSEMRLQPTRVHHTPSVAAQFSTSPGIKIGFFWLFRTS